MRTPSVPEGACVGCLAEGRLVLRRDHPEPVLFAGSGALTAREARRGE